MSIFSDEEDHVKDALAKWKGVSHFKSKWDAETGKSWPAPARGELVSEIEAIAPIGASGVKPPSVGDAASPMDGFRKIVRRLRLGEREAAALLGFIDVAAYRDESFVRAAAKCRDFNDRLKIVSEIAEAIEFRFPKPDDACKWLRQPRMWLENQSPIELILEGSMKNLLRLHQYVERLSRW